jgi:hypothetical protein
MSRLSRLAVAVALGAITLRATTLEQLSLDDLIQKSTGIVRATVTASYTAARGADIYTYYKLDVAETWKGPAIQTEVAVPGGALRGVRQMVAGAPALRNGQEYVLFLWTSRSGLTQVIGMSQGMFQVTKDTAGNVVLMRAAATESMVDRNGRQVTDRGISMRLSDMQSRVRRSLAGAAQEAEK